MISYLHFPIPCNMCYVANILSSYIDINLINHPESKNQFQEKKHSVYYWLSSKSSYNKLPDEHDKFIRKIEPFAFIHNIFIQPLSLHKS